MVPNGFSHGICHYSLKHLTMFYLLSSYAFRSLLSQSMLNEWFVACLLQGSTQYTFLGTISPSHSDTPPHISLCKLVFIINLFNFCIKKTFLSSPNDVLSLLFREREEGRERNIDAGEKLQLVASPTRPDGRWLVPGLGIMCAQTWDPPCNLPVMG